MVFRTDLLTDLFTETRPVDLIHLPAPGIPDTVAAVVTVRNRRRFYVRNCIHMDNIASSLDFSTISINIYGEILL